MNLFKEISTYAVILMRRITTAWKMNDVFDNACKVAIAYLISILARTYVFIIAIVILVLTDMVSGIVSSMKKGAPFNSRKLRTGLIERLILYGLLFIVALCVDTIVMHYVSFSQFFVTIFVCTVIGFYEASSTVENLISAYPKFTFLKKVANLLNLLQKIHVTSSVEKVEKIMKEEEEE